LCRKDLPASDAKEKRVLSIAMGGKMGCAGKEIGPLMKKGTKCCVEGRRKESNDRPTYSMLRWSGFF